MKIAVRITNFGAAINIGGDPEVKTTIVEIDSPRLEALLKPEKYCTKSISVVEEDP